MNSLGVKLIHKMPLVNSLRIFNVDSCQFSRCAWLGAKPTLYPKNAKKRRASKEAFAFKKVFGSGDNTKKRKKKWLDDMTGVLPTNAMEHKKSKPSVGIQRRAHQLNVVLYDEITRILSTGEVGPQLIPLGFHITMVDMALDFSVVNVRWEATGTERDKQIEQYLPQCEGDLRRALISYRVVGNVPAIQFVKDLTANRLREVERLLDLADKGPDYEPPELGHNLKSPKLPHYTSLQQTFTNAAMNFNEKDIVKRASRTGAMEVMDDSFAIGLETQEETLPILDDFADLKIMSNAYDVDHAGYATKILQLKKLSEKRGSGLGLGERLQASGGSEITLDNAKLKDIKKLLEARKGQRSSKTVGSRFSKNNDNLSPWKLAGIEGQDLTSGLGRNDNEDYYQEPQDYYEPEDWDEER